MVTWTPLRHHFSLFFHVHGDCGICRQLYYPFPYRFKEENSVLVALSSPPPDLWAPLLTSAGYCFISEVICIINTSPYRLLPLTSQEPTWESLTLSVTHTTGQSCFLCSHLKSMVLWIIYTPRVSIPIHLSLRVKDTTERTIHCFISTTL